MNKIETHIFNHHVQGIENTLFVLCFTGTFWKTAQDNKVCKYDYTYDKTGRLTGATFNKYTGTSFNKTAGVYYSVSNLSYDLSGNIKSMTQMGLLSSGIFSIIDQLTYGCQSGTGRLIKVTAAAAIDILELMGDFQDGNKSVDDYSHNGNGCFTQDLNKKISSISYNILNLPSKISVTGKWTIYYTYDVAVKWEYL